MTMHAEPGLIPSLMPIVFLFIPLAVIAFKIAKRRGRNGWLWALIALIPYFNLLFLLYLASLPETSLVERIEAIEARLDRRAQPGSAPPPRPTVAT